MEVTRLGNKMALSGELPEVGDKLPKFKLFDQQNNKVKTANLIGQVALISVVPDLDTPVCTLQTRKFVQQADHYPAAKFYTVSNNSVAEQTGWCAAQGVENVDLLSDEELSFGYETGLYVPNAGNLARSIWIIDETGKIVYRQVVVEQSDEPDYLDALNALEKLVPRVDA
ncbi:MAG TPA: peroxiredoxin [Candidatus Levilactobacillus faecigallinarum]|uniref:Peroxiredoxin n=1 Tax=Candidatus Levilactobacillus faecigallinarum TaxID=2838638 RepID=A0A9D1QQK4_9LACO|nr:peroxiredoxin [Candidatus Levilactobacillus faecigallinarum]